MSGTHRFFVVVTEARMLPQVNPTCFFQKCPAPAKPRVGGVPASPGLQKTKRDVPGAGKSCPGDTSPRASFPREALTRRCAVAGIEFDGDVTPAELLRSDGGGTRPRERIKDQLALPREGLDERRDRGDRLLGRVAPVAGIVPAEDIVDDLPRVGEASRQQVGGLVAIPQEARLIVRVVELHPHEMSNRPEAGSSPHYKEPVGLVPPVEAHAEVMVLEDSGNLRERRREPRRSVIVRDCPSGAVPVPCAIGRVGHHKINTRVGHGGHDWNAVTADYAVGKCKRHWFWCGAPWGQDRQGEAPGAVVFDILKQLTEPPPDPPKRPIGFVMREKRKK